MQSCSAIRRSLGVICALGVALSGCVGSALPPSPVSSSPIAVAAPAAIKFDFTSRSESNLGLHVSEISVDPPRDGWVVGGVEVVVWNDGPKPMLPRQTRITRAYVDTLQGRTYEAVSVCAKQSTAKNSTDCQALPISVYLVRIPGEPASEQLAAIPSGLPVGGFRVGFRYAEAATPKSLVLEFDSGDVAALGLYAFPKPASQRMSFRQAYPSESRILSIRPLGEFFTLEQTGSSAVNVDVDYSCMNWSMNLSSKSSNSNYTYIYPMLQFTATNTNKFDQEELHFRFRSNYPYYSYNSGRNPSQDITYFRRDEWGDDNSVVLGPGQVQKGNALLDAGYPLDSSGFGPEIYIFETVKGTSFENVKVNRCGVR